MNTLRPVVNKYDVLVCLGNFPIERNLPLFPDIELDVGILPLLLTDDIYEQINDLKGDFVVTKDTARLLDISVRKMDKPPVYEFENDLYFKDALRIWDVNWAPALLQDHMSPTEVLETMKMDKSAGFILAQNGFKKKGDYFSVGGLMHILHPSIMNEKDLWKAAGKLEKRPRHKYVDDESLRTFIIESPQQGYHQKRIFGNQNKAMKMFWWSGYGINPFEGGTNLLATKLNKFRYKFMLDAVKWDRLASWMKHAYNLRMKYVPDDPFLQWVVKNNICSYVVLPNGDLIFKKHGNNSGSSLTTGNNILGMSLILAHAYCIMVNGNEYMMDHINDYMFNVLFGDDVVGGFDIPGVTPELFRNALIDTFKRLYGIVLDPLVVTEDLHDLSFLGFKFTFNQTHGWLPKYDLSILSTTFLYTSKKIDKDGEVSKLITVMLMSAGNGKHYYDLFRDAVLHILVNTQCELGATMLKLGIPSYEETLNWYSGYEGNRQVFDFLNDYILDFII